MKDQLLLEVCEEIKESVDLKTAPMISRDALQNARYIALESALVAKMLEALEDIKNAPPDIQFKVVDYC